MKTKIEEMEDELLEIFKISKSLNRELTKDTVYYELTRGSILRRDRKFKVNELFPFFITYFQNHKNIKVYNSMDWKYFCQFENHNKKNNTLFNPIKMYFSVNGINIKEFVVKLFDFLERNNINHDSKVASEIRSDCIVVRVYNREDENKIRNFINNNAFMKSSLNKPNPFIFEKDNIGYALDGFLSYNSVVSNYILKYINEMNKEKGEISIKGLYLYVANLYNDIFISKKGIDDFILEYDLYNDIYYYGKEVILNNYQEVTKLFLFALNGYDLSYFMSLVSEFNDENEVRKNREGFSKKKKNNESENLEEKLVFLKKAIFETYKKYQQDGLGQIKHALVEIYSFKNYKGFTRQNNTREELINNVSLDEIKYIIDYYGGIDNFINYIFYDMKYDKQENISKNNIDFKVKIFNDAIIKTYEKYNFEQVKYILKMTLMLLQMILMFVII